MKPACTCLAVSMTPTAHCWRHRAESRFPRPGVRLAPVQCAYLRHRRTRRGATGQHPRLALRCPDPASARYGAELAHQPAVWRRAVPAAAAVAAAHTGQPRPAGAHR
ncbi:hypothetical protein G6F68_021092 [Rhizopus microsporus]|nr:hypothetical protein G6F68_021092 [Rhizopus microsporus]